MRLAALASLLASCAAPPEPQPLSAPPGLEIGLHYHAGGIVAGPAPSVQAQAFEPADALSFDCEVVFVDELPLEGLEPLESLTSFVASIEQGQPIVPHALFLRRAAFARGAAAETLRNDLAAGRYGRTLTLADFAGALPRDATAVLGGEAIESSASPLYDSSAQLASNFLGLHLARAGESIALGLGLRDSTRPHDLPVDTAAPPGESADSDGAAVLRHEIVLLEPIPFDSELTTALVLPTLFQRSEGKAFVVFVGLRKPPSEADAEAWHAHAAVVDEVRAEVEASAKLVAEEVHLERPDEAVYALLRTVIDAQEPGKVDEQALFGLASSVHAEIARDLLLVGDERLIDDFVRGLIEERAQALELDSRPAFAWLLDRNAWRVIGGRLLESDLDLVCDSMALRHAGELGRYPASLLEGVDDAFDGPSFQRFVEQENLLFLNDAHPSARIRAFGWLQLNSSAPEGYDPLAAAEERREVLEAFFESLREHTAEAPAEPKP